MLMASFDLFASPYRPLARRGKTSSGGSYTVLSIAHDNSHDIMTANESAIRQALLDCPSSIFIEADSDVFVVPRLARTGEISSYTALEDGPEKEAALARVRDEFGDALFDLYFSDQIQGATNLSEKQVIDALDKNLPLIPYYAKQCSQVDARRGYAIRSELEKTGNVEAFMHFLFNYESHIRETVHWQPKLAPALESDVLVVCGALHGEEAVRMLEKGVQTKTFPEYSESFPEYRPMLEKVNSFQ